MEPLTPQDPLWRLLGKAREAAPRGDFTQGVVRLARQTPQDTGWWPRVRAWFAPGESLSLPRVAFAALPVIAAVSFGLMSLTTGGSGSGTVVAQAPASPPAAEITAPEDATTVAEQWENVEQMTELLAVEDTSTLTDREIAILLY